MRQTSIAVISPLAAWARMSTPPIRKASIPVISADPRRLASTRLDVLTLRPFIHS